MLPDDEQFEITVQEVAALRADADSPVRIIDCREDDEFAYCRMEGAELIPLSRFAELAETRLLAEEGETAAPVVVYCHHGMRSMNATQFLRAKGRTRVWSMRGGIDAWSAEIDPEVPRY